MGRALYGLPHSEGRYQFVPRDGDIDLAQAVLEKSRIKGIELFGLGRKCERCAETLDNLRILVMVFKIKTPFFKLGTHFRGFVIPVDYPIYKWSCHF